MAGYQTIAAKNHELMVRNAEVAEVKAKYLHSKQRAEDLKALQLKIQLLREMGEPVPQELIKAVVDM